MPTLNYTMDANNQVFVGRFSNTALTDLGVAAANQIGFFATGAAVGSANVSINFELNDTRSDCKHVKIYCVEC